MSSKVLPSFSYKGYYNFDLVLPFAVCTNIYEYWIQFFLQGYKSLYEQFINQYLYWTERLFQIWFLPFRLLPHKNIIIVDSFGAVWKILWREIVCIHKAMEQFSSKNGTEKSFSPRLLLLLYVFRSCKKTWFVYYWVLVVLVGGTEIYNALSKNYSHSEWLSILRENLRKLVSIRRGILFCVEKLHVSQLLNQHA